MVKLWDFELAKLKKIKTQFSKYLIAEGGSINKNKYRKFEKIFDPSNSYRKDKVKKAYNELYSLINPPTKTENKVYETSYTFDINNYKYISKQTGEELQPIWEHSNQIRRVKKWIKQNGLEKTYQIFHSIEFSKQSKKYDFINYRGEFTKEINELTKDIVDKIHWLWIQDSEGLWIVDKYLNREVVTSKKDEKGNIISKYPFKNQSVKVSTYIADVVKYKPKPNFNALQTYRENINGICVYDNIMTFLLNKYEATQNKNIKTRINKLNKNQELKKSYTLEELKELTNLLDISITIKDLVNGVNHHVACDNPKKNIYNIEMVNSRVNHLDLYTANTDIIEIDGEEYDRLKRETNYYIEKLGILHTLNGNFKCIDNDFQSVYKAWKNKINYNSLSIPLNSQAYELINTYDYSMHRIFNNFDINNHDYVEWDLKKAYYNYSDINYNKYYVGVPSGGFINVKFNNNMNTEKFSKMTFNGLIGFFNIEVLDDNLKDFGFYKGSFHTLFTSQIMLIIKHCSINFICGSYSKSVHIPFTEDFTKEIRKGLKYYSKAHGLMQLSNDYSTYFLKHTCKDEDFYSIIHNDNFNYYIEDTPENYTLLRIVEKNKTPSSHIHIASSIHAYTKTLVLEQMIEVGIENIFGVKLDSIVFKIEVDTDFIRPKHFGVKDAKIQKMFSRGIYETKKYFYNCKRIDNFNLSFLPNNEIIINPIVYLNGKGGCGKTYSLCTNDNFDVSNLCYSTTANRLINEQTKKHNKIIGLSIPKLIGEFNGISIPYKENSKIKILGLDEATLWTDYQIKKAFKLYSHCIIFIMGDMDIINKKPYQCTMTDKIFNDFEKCQVIQYTKNYRFNNELNNYLDQLRLEMTKNNNDTSKLFKYVKNTLSNRFFKKEDIIYNNNDIGINCLRDSEEITNYFLEKGTQPKYFVKTSKLGLAKGEQYETKPDNKNYEMKLFHTIHSFQGCQLDEDNKIIIYLDRLFDYNLLYTALSRARRIDQIYIIL